MPHTPIDASCLPLWGRWQGFAGKALPYEGASPRRVRDAAPYTTGVMCSCSPVPRNLPQMREVAFAKQMTEGVKPPMPSPKNKKPPSFSEQRAIDSRYHLYFPRPRGRGLTESFNSSRCNARTRPAFRRTAPEPYIQSGLPAPSTNRQLSGWDFPRLLVFLLRLYGRDDSTPEPVLSTGRPRTIRKVCTFCREYQI